MAHDRVLACAQLAQFLDPAVAREQCCLEIDGVLSKVPARGHTCAENADLLVEPPSLGIRA
ncbi:hypothetical protein [Streptomyces sp. NPDC056227]|uniref:hypothetical protein n=1 Tax=Streptomyces sp. NPDC056227 TaxID=3345753 RepID=UPI0035DFB66A